MKLSKENLKEILENYNLGKYKSSKQIWWAFGNTVIILKTTKGKYVLKLFHSEKPNHIKFQIDLIDNLSKTSLPIPQIIKTTKKENRLKYNDSVICLQEFAEGKQTYTFNPKLIKDCAIQISRLDQALAKTKSKSLFNYQKDHQFKPNFKVKRIGKFNLSKEAKEIHRELKKIDKKKLKKNFIHGDFHGVNILSKKNKITAILDFDDAHYDYIAEEIAVFIAHSFVHKDRIHEEKIKTFFKEYSKYNKLNEEEIKAIYYFIKQRFLASLNWTELHKRKLKENNKINTTNKNLRNSIKSYANFSKISLQNFRELSK